MKSLTGIPTEGTEPQGLEEVKFYSELVLRFVQVLSNMTESLTTQFQQAFDTTQDSFLWDEVLDWEMPVLECPEGVDPTVCLLPMLRSMDILGLCVC